MNKMSHSIAQKDKLNRHWFVFGGVCLIFFLLFMHPDAMETANHAYLLLESVFSGRFMHYYTDVMAHNNTLYYINNAHYNIFIYIIFAVVELPIFVFNKLAGLPVHEFSLFFVGKLVGILFFVGCLLVFPRIARAFGLNQTDSRYATLFLALSPLAFFSGAIMGQYDSICLLFTLIGVLYWLRGRYGMCSFWIGFGAACKFFPLLLLIPLILLVEKRPLHILKYGAISLWLLLPTMLLFSGRTGDASVFNGAMMSRLFAIQLPLAMDTPVFPLLYGGLCLLAWLWKPADDNHRKKIGIWLCLAAFGLIFLFMHWHPQWVILICPFLVLSTFAEKERTRWFWMDIIMAAGFILFCFVVYPLQLEANLVNFGIPAYILDMRTTDIASRNVPVVFYLELISPILLRLPMVLFGAVLSIHIALKIPLKGGTPAQRLSGNSLAAPAPAALARWAWLVFGVSIFLWLVPTVFTWLKDFSWL